MSIVSAEPLMGERGLRPLVDALRPIVAPGPIVAHWDRLFDPNVDRFRLHVGPRDRYTAIISRDAWLLAKPSVVIATELTKAVDYAFHVRECYEGIRDLVDP